jgi:serine/threonine-protein kinase
MTANNITLFDLVPGKVLLDRYRIVRPQRQSGKAATFEVKVDESGSRRELLVFPAGLFEGPEQAAEFVQNMKEWKGLSTPVHAALRENLVLADGSVLLVSDFPPGESLRTWLEENTRMPVEAALAFAVRLLSGLKEIHEAGLVHGDIKPQTIYFVSDAERVVLVDGGVTSGLWGAKHLGTRTALIGTPYYAPLEQFGGDSPDVSSDLYNLATVLYELVTGVLPWTGKSFLEVFQAKMGGVPAMSSRAPGLEVSHDFEAAVLHGLKPRRNDRFASADEFLSSLTGVEIA